MNRKQAWILVAVAMVTAAVAPALAGDDGKLIVTPSAELKWKEMAPGVHAAVVEGDMAAGPSRFYLKYAAGLVTPVHRHSADHYATVVSGTLVATVDGKEYTLTPGSYFALTGKKAHAARVEGKEDCVMFIHAAAPWDVVLEKQ